MLGFISKRSIFFSYCFTTFFLALSSFGEVFTEIENEDEWGNWDNKEPEPEVKIKRWTRSGICDHDALTSVLLRIVLDIQDGMRGGNPSIGVPALDPLIISEVEFDAKGFQYCIGRNTVVRGLSHFRISDIQSDYDKMEANISLQFDTMAIRGDYKLRGIVRTPMPIPIIGNGKFLLTPKRTTLDIFSIFGYNAEGQLVLTKFDFDLKRGDLFVRFDGIWGAGRTITAILNALGLEVFDTLEPRNHDKMREQGLYEINKILVDLKYEEAWVTEMSEIPLRCFFG